MKPSRGEIILDRLKTEAALEDDSHPIRKRSFLLAVEEIERLRAALSEIAEHPGPHADEAAWYRVEIAKTALCCEVRA